MSIKTVLITGASSGIGYASAELLAKNGYDVYAAARRTERMKPLEKFGAHIMQLDVIDEKQCRTCVDAVVKESGKIDILFNNAGLGIYGPVEEIPLQEARYEFEVNFFAAANLTRLVLPHMRMAGKGRIIFTSSIAAKVYLPLGAWYHASKHAIEGWADCLRAEVKQFGIDVVLIEPGIIVTDFWNVVDKNIRGISPDSPYKRTTDKLLFREQIAHSPKWGTSPDKVAKTVLTACSAKRPKIRYRTGMLSNISVLGREILGDRIFDKIINMLY